MAPLKKNTALVHFTHPGHPLAKLEAKAEYTCDGCKTLGTGVRYRCSHHTCNFDLHEYCATCPRNLSSFMHPHPLSLLVCKTQATYLNRRTCNVCAEPVEGLFYRCKDCEFDVHPLCTQLPQDLRHILHPMHPLTLQASKSSWCMVCGGTCASWRYGCEVCSFNIHLECVILACDASTRGPTPPSPSGTSQSVPTFGTHPPPTSGPTPPSPSGTSLYVLTFGTQPPPTRGPTPPSPSGTSRFVTTFGTQPPPFGATPPWVPPCGALPNGIPGAGYQYPSNMYNAMYPDPTNTHNYGNSAQVGSAPYGAKKQRSTFSLSGRQAAGMLSNVIFGVDLISPFIRKSSISTSTVHLS